MNFTKEYTLLADHANFKAGDTVTAAKFHDYGLASDDTRYTGFEHVSVSKDGNYPLQTVPITKLKAL